MEALAVVGLAAAVAQFVEFTSSLVTTAADTYRSQTGATDEHANLEQVYSKLEKLCSQLSTSEDDRITASGYSANASVPEMDELKALAAECRSDCEALASAVRNLIGERGQKSPLKSCKAALKTALGQRKLAELEARIGRTRCVLALQISAIVRSVVVESHNPCNKLADLLCAQPAVAEAAVVSSFPDRPEQ